MRTLVKALLPWVALSFEVPSAEYGRFLAVTPEQLASVWKAILVNLGEVHKGEYGRAERLARAVLKPVLEGNHPLLLGALRVTFVWLPPGAVHAALLGLYTSVRADIEDFIDPEQRLGFAVLVSLLLSLTEELRAAAREAIARIERAGGDAPIARAVADRVEEAQLARMALHTLSCGEGIDDGWLKIIGDLFDALAEAQGREAAEFRIAAVKRFVDAAVTAKGKESEVLGQLLHRVYQ